MFRAILKSVGLLLLYMMVAGVLLSASYSHSPKISDPSSFFLVFNVAIVALGLVYIFRSSLGRLRAVVIAAPSVFVAFIMGFSFLSLYFSSEKVAQLRTENPAEYIEKARLQTPLFEYLKEAKRLGGTHLGRALELTVADVGLLAAADARQLRDFIKANADQIGAAAPTYLEILEAHITGLNKAERIRNAEENPGSVLEIKKFDWRIDGFGTVMIANFQITNKSTLTFKDIEIKCDLFGESGTRVSGTNTTVFQVIKAGKTKSLKEVNMGFINSQAAQASCKVDSAALVR